MARYQKQRRQYPIGSVSCGTMREEDLIPDFLQELRQHKGEATFRRSHHAGLCRDIARRMESEEYYESGDAGYDLESLFDALGEYAGPYFYFGAHPGDGSDYGYWLSENWDEEFVDALHNGAPALRKPFPNEPVNRGISLKVNDLSEIPSWFRGEVAVVNDHGNVTLYVKNSRGLREVWAIV